MAFTYSEPPRWTPLEIIFNEDNSTNGTKVRDLIERPEVRYTLIAFQLLFILLATLGNGFLIFFIFRNWRVTRRNVTAFLVLNLAICDFINVIVYQPMKLADLFLYQEDPGSGSLVFCKVTGYFSSFFAGVAFCCMVAISVERMLLICHPFSAKRYLTFRNLVIVMVVIWTLVSLTALPLPILFTFVVRLELENSHATFCLFDPYTPKNGTIYIWFVTILYFVLPVVVISVAYTRVFLTLNKSLATKEYENEGIRRMNAQRKSLAKMMLSIALIFVVSIGPHFIVVITLAMGFQIKKNPIFIMVLIDIFAMISPMMNPFVYTVKPQVFRRGVTRGSSEVSQQAAYDSRVRTSLYRPDVPLIRNSAGMDQSRSSNTSRQSSAGSADSHPGKPHVRSPAVLYLQPIDPVVEEGQNCEEDDQQNKNKNKQNGVKETEEEVQLDPPLHIGRVINIEGPGRYSCTSV